MEQRNRLCHRHRNMNSSQNIRENVCLFINELDMQILSKYPADQQEKILQILSFYKSSDGNVRQLILSGILLSSCIPQLSYLHTNIPPLLRMDIVGALPYELSLKILLFCDAKSLCRAAQVSRLWRQLADDDFLWHRLCEQHIDRRCNKCGWGLPLIVSKALFTPLISCLQPLEFESVTSADQMEVEQQQMMKRENRRKWKQIYGERLIVEKNWRNNRSVSYSFIGHTAPVLCLQVEDDLLLSGSEDGTVRVWSLHGLKECKMILSGHQGPVLALQSDSSKIFSASADGTIRIWNKSNGQLIRTLTCHRAAVTTLSFDDTVLASGSRDCTVKIWNFSKSECFTLNGHTAAVTQVVLDKKCRLYSSSVDATVRIWDWDLRQCIRTFRHLAPINCIQPACKPADCSLPFRILITASSDCSVGFWRIETGEEICEKLICRVSPVSSVTANSLRVATAGLEGIFVNDIITKKLMFKFDLGKPIPCLKMTDTLLLASNGNYISVWDFAQYTHNK